MQLAPFARGAQALLVDERLVDLECLRFFVALEHSVDGIPPHFTDRLTYVRARKHFIRVVVFGDFGFGIRNNEGHIIREWLACQFNHICPGNGQFKSFCLQITCILGWDRRTINRRKNLPRDQHIRGFTNVAVE
ncbi:hypothetical protein D3C87_1750580 [compost metagenome]